MLDDATALAHTNTLHGTCTYTCGWIRPTQLNIATFVDVHMELAQHSSAAGMHDIFHLSMFVVCVLPLQVCHRPGPVATGQSGAGGESQRCSLPLLLLRGHPARSHSRGEGPDVQVCTQR